MKTKEKLGQIKIIDKLIELKYTELGQLKDTEKVLTALPYNKGCLNVLDREQEKIMFQIERLLKEKYEMSRIIDSVSDVEKRLILDMRFLQGYTIRDIAKSLDYSMRHADRLINAAIDVVIIERNDE